MSSNHTNTLSPYSDLESELASLDFSTMSNKKRVYEATQKRLESTHTNKNTRINPRISGQKRLLTIAASFILIGLMVTQTTYAKDFVDYMIKLVMIGESKVIQIEKPKEVTQEDYQQANRSQSEQTSTIQNADVIDFNQLSDLAGKTSFEVKLPQYLPEGYAFNRGEFYKSEDGSISKDYVSLYYLNVRTNEKIILQSRVTNDDTDYVAITDGNITEVNIRGMKAAMINESSLQWSEENAAYHLSSKGNIGRDELIKIAESIR